MQKEEKKRSGATEAQRAHLLGEQLYRALFKVKVFLGRQFYELGTQTEYLAVRTARRIVRTAHFIGTHFKKQSHTVGGWIHGAAGAVCRDLAEPFDRVKSGAANIRTVMEEAKKENGRGHAAKKGATYFFSGLKRYAYLAKKLLWYFLPVAAGAVFIVTVSSVLGRDYALAVEYKGDLVGYAKDSSVYTTAKKMVEGRIVYTGTEQESWNMNPTFSVVSAKPDQISDTETLADAILQASGAEITEAVGLYVDNEFYGATTDSLQLENDLEQIKRPYQEMYPDAEIGFVKDVRLTSGVYLTSTVKDYSELSGLLTSETQGQRVDVIQKGDTPLIIAGRNGVTLADLYAMNPVLENGKNAPIGQELLISAPQNFLQVKAVLTETVEEEVPYTQNRTYDDNLAFGVNKVKQKGVNGVDSVTYSRTIVDGIQVARVEIARSTISAPVTEEVSVGRKTVLGTFTPGTGAYLFPVGPGYKYMSRGFTGVYAHNGLDLCGYVGTPIYAAQSGVVSKALYTSRGYGIYAMIDHGNGVSTLYGHCSALAVSAGQYVTKGQVIAYLGSSGNSTGPHCHFEVIVNGTRVNPMGYLG